MLPEMSQILIICEDVNMFLRRTTIGMVCDIADPVLAQRHATNLTVYQIYDNL